MAVDPAKPSYHPYLVCNGTIEDITIHVPRESGAYCEGASEFRAVGPERALCWMNWSGDILRCTWHLRRHGAVRRHLNLFVNIRHARSRRARTALVPGDEIIILPAVSGG